jgi:hypothetical protein
MTYGHVLWLGFEVWVIFISNNANLLQVFAFGEERDCSKGGRVFGHIVLWRGLGIKSLLDDLQLWNHDTTQSLEQQVRNIRVHTLESINPAMSSAVI